MQTLREKLEGLSAARSRARPGPLPEANRAVAGFDLREEIIPLSARSELTRLLASDPQLAALLLPDPQTTVPPLRDWLFLDLETTGLAGGTGTYAFLVGLGRVTDEGFHLQQYFLRDLAAETEMLQAMLPLLNEARALVTYNGKRFDAPLLETRFRLARLKLRSEFFHLDLLYPARRLWRHRWESLRLLDLERNLLGFHRAEDIPGELIPSTYFEFLRRGEESRLALVFRHNADDLLTLAAITARVLQLLSAPETAAPVELFSLARVFERARELDRARELYEQALAAGLPAELNSAAGFRLSLLCKRQRDYARAVALWQELLDSGEKNGTNDGLAVCEELAICYEHRLDDPESAAELTRRALASLDHNGTDGAKDRRNSKGIRARLRRRLQRLTRKQPQGSAVALF